MKNELFPFQVSKPSEMTVLEQVICAVWLSMSKSLKELRVYQDMIELQLIFVRKHNPQLDTLNNLLAMQDNYAAAVALQSFGIDEDDSCWLSFINVK
jgi:hypothetical protein